MDPFPKDSMTLLTDRTTERPSDPSPYALGAWQLTELLPDASEETLRTRLAEVERDVETLEAARPRLAAGIDATALHELLVVYERLTERVHVLGSYASLWFAADTQSTAALTFRSRVQQVLTGYGNRLLFFSLWWKDLDDEVAERLLAGLAPAAGDGEAARRADFVHHLRDVRRLKPYTLSETSEQIINLKDADGMGGLLTVYSMLTNRLEFTLDTGGGPRTLTRDALMAHVYSPVAAEREAAYRELYRVFGAEAKVLGEIYAHRVRDWTNEHVTLRGYASPIAVRNVDNDVPDAAVDALLDVARENADVFRRYFRLKAKWLDPGATALRRYDLYAPAASSQRTVPWEDAVALVLDTFRAFHPRFGEQAERVFADRHLDGEVRKGKKGGAFCATVSPALTPWVLMNYTGRVRDVATLAHELGHAIHSMMAEGHSVLTQHSSLPLAETASVFAEILLTDRLLGEEKDPLARRELLAAALDDVYATVLRQAYFVLFEREAHAGVLGGKSSDELSELYLSLLREQLGDAVVVPDEFRHEWVSIPHIYSTPFYCYAYSFGQLLVLALYRRFQQEGEAFKPGYLRLLAWGGAARPEEILAEVGVDPKDRGFWRGGFDVVRDMVAEVEATGA